MKTIILGVLLLVSPAILHAQQTMGAEMDATTYKLDSTKAIVEISYGILYRQLKFTSDKGGWTAPIEARVEAWQSGATAATQDIHQHVHFEGTKQQFDDAAATKVVGIANLPVAYGAPVRAVLFWKYQRADGSLAVDTLIRDVPVPELFPDRLSFSSIELASSLEKATSEGNPLEKVGYIVTPNPSSVFGDTYTKLYYYAELYLPSAFVVQGATAQINAVIQDGAGHTLVNTTRNQELIAQSIPVLGSLDIDGLPGDNYKLIITATRNGAVEAQTSKKFFYESGIKLSEESNGQAASPGTMDDQAIYLNSEISKMPESELNERFEQAGYLARPEDKKAWKSISVVDEKRKFLFSFWRKRDKPTDKPLASYYIYVQRTEQANKNYTHQKTVGWKSDRGRIYMTYGPDFIEQKHPFSTEALPYITWTYNDRSILINASAGASLPLFVFVDRQGAGNYVLVHSNVQGETAEPNWYNTVAKRTY